MAVVDPEQLEREAEELMRKHGLIEADPATDTPPQSAPEPAPQADTPGEPPAPATEDGLDRGDPANSVDDIEEIEVLRERYRNAQAAMTRASQRASDAERSVADLRREIADLRASQPAQQAPQNADEAEALLQNALKEYPEIVGPILKRLETVEATARTAHTEVVQRKSEDAQSAHLAEIRKAHSDLDQVSASPEFSGWVSRQSPTWQQVAVSGTAEEVIELLDRYKEAVGIAKAPQPQRDERMERARQVAEPTLPKNRKPDPNAGKRVWTRKEIGAMSLEAYEKHREDIDRAYLEGRVR